MFGSATGALPYLVQLERGGVLVALLLVHFLENLCKTSGETFLKNLKMSSVTITQNSSRPRPGCGSEKGLTEHVLQADDAVDEVVEVDLPVAVAVAHDERVEGRVAHLVACKHNASSHLFPTRTAVLAN